MLITRTPLRISLFGGGTDLPAFYENNQYGKVLSFSIDKYIYLSAHPLVEDTSILLKYSKQEYVKSPELLQHPVARHLLTELNLSGLDLSVTSDIPAGTGMGSSSAFAVGLYHLLSEYTHSPKSKFELARYACHLEIEILGQRIGKQDQYACAFGGINELKFHDNSEVSVDRIHLSKMALDEFNKSLYLVRVGGTRSATDALVRQNFNLANESDLDLRDRYLSLRDMTSLGVQYLQQGNLEKLGGLLNEAWRLKKSFEKSISNQHVDEIVNSVLELGAYGAKLLGAGGSGYVLALVPEGRRSDFVQSFGSHIVKPNVDWGGSTVIYASE